MSVSQASYSELVDILEAELAVVADDFEGLTTGQWGAPTKLTPVEPDKSPWTLFELAGHLDISIGITTMLIADAVPGEREAERDAVDFFIFPSERPDGVLQLCLRGGPGSRSHPRCQPCCAVPSPRQSSRREAVTLAQSARFQATSRTR